MQPEITEYGLFRSIFGPRPDEPITELIDIIYSYVVTYFERSENKDDQSQSKKDEKGRNISFHDDSNGSDPGNQSNNENRDKPKDLSYETKKETNPVEKGSAPVTSSTPIGEL